MATAETGGSPIKRDGMGKTSNYLRLGKLGEGGFGAAYLVRKRFETDGKQYVMKEIQCKTKEEVLQALREMVTLRIAQCPYVVQYEEYFQKGLSVFLVMEHCAGGDLYTEMNAALKKGKRMKEDRIMQIFTQMALGLESIHSKSLMHRDVKPSNVFLDEAGNAKLGDFGLSNQGGRTPEEVVAATLCGTPGFISPEIEKGQPYNAKSDIYALGCTLYEMLCLRSAYQDSLDNKFPQPIPKYYSDELRNLLALLLEKDPVQRISSSQLLKHSYVAKYKTQLAVVNSIDTQMKDVPSPRSSPSSALDLQQMVHLVKQGDVKALASLVQQHPATVAALGTAAYLSLKVIGLM